MLPIVTEEKSDLAGIRIVFKWTVRNYQRRIGATRDDYNAGYTYKGDMWAEWDSWRHVLQFRFPPRFEDGSPRAYFHSQTLEDARRLVVEASHGLIVRQVSHDRWVPV